LNVKTVLVTGGCGFIGTNLIKRLIEQGYRVKVLDNLSVGKAANLTGLSRKCPQGTTIDLTTGDVTDRKAVEDAVDGADAVVHLAAFTGVAISLEHPEEAWDINVNGTLNLLEACRLNNVDRFVFASSNAAVGARTPPVDENQVPSPVSPYGASKLAGESLCTAYYHSFNLKTTSLRFANCYGPYSEHKQSVIPTLMRLVGAGQPFTIYGDGNQTRDFIHVDDVCNAILLTLKPADVNWGEVYQIATGTETSINELVDIAKEITGINFEVLHSPVRSGEVTRLYSDISKARAVLGFEPGIELREGLKQLWQTSLNKRVVSKS
jgi:UDP-glucose 4-epimerase